MTDTSDQHRHRCEVRTLILAIAQPGRGREWVRQYLDDKRVAGRQAQLRADLNEQIKAGNSGQEGEWK